MQCYHKHGNIQQCTNIDVIYMQSAKNPMLENTSSEYMQTRKTVLYSCNIRQGYKSITMISIFKSMTMHAQ